MSETEPVMGRIEGETGWPELPAERLTATADTLQRWAQIVGKVRLARTPWLNHSWHATLYVSGRGLTTSLIPFGDMAVELEFDFVAQNLVVRSTSGGERRIVLRAMTVAEFYAEVIEALAGLGAAVVIDPRPNELPDATPFAEDRAPRSYDPDMARNLWRALVRVEAVFSRFRTRFVGKSSPIHLFWGSFDLAVTRFSGRRAPAHPGGIPHLPDDVTREAYSHEVCSAGFWPGGAGTGGASFYAYAYPSPAGFALAEIRPAQARFSPELGEFLLSYAAVRAASDPDEYLLAFLQSTYEAAADLAGWDRVALERPEGRVGRPG